MAQYKRSREKVYCNSVNNNEHENPPKRPCSISDAGVLLLSDLLFADDDVDDINAQDLQAAQNALLLDMNMMTSLDREMNYCNSSMNSSVFDAEVQYSLYRPNFWDNRSSSSIVGESALASSSCKMDDETCTVSLDYLLRATDEELGIPPSQLSDLSKTDHEATYNSHDTGNIWDGLMLQIELLSGIETVDGIAGHFTPAHAI
jgi:hypothetical protein